MWIFLGKETSKEISYLRSTKILWVTKWFLMTILNMIYKLSFKYALRSLLSYTDYDILICKHVYESPWECLIKMFYQSMHLSMKFASNDLWVSMSLMRMVLKKKPWYSIYQVLDGQCAQSGVWDFVNHLASYFRNLTR